MNRLKGLTTYLSGPIDFAENFGADWRDELTPWLVERGIKVLDPLKHCFWGTQEIDDIKRPKMDKLLSHGDYEMLRKEMKDVNHWDLRCVDLSSFIIVNCDNSVHMCGTYEEIFKANNQCKPVLLKLSGPMNELSKWMYGRFPPTHMFDSWDSLKSYLVSIDTDPQYEFTSDDEKRWLFWDGIHMTPDYKPRHSMTKFCMEGAAWDITDDTTGKIVVGGIKDTKLAEKILELIEENSPMPEGLGNINLNTVVR